MISAEYPPVSMASRALAMHSAKVSASLRHGITIVTSAAGGSYCTGDEGRGAVFMALEPNAGCRPQLAVATEKINARWSPRPDLLRPSPDTPPSRRHPAWPRRGVGLWTPL